MDNVLSMTDSGSQKCIFNCEDPTASYPLPVNEEERQIWLKYLDIPSSKCNHSTRICKSHFSERMFTDKRRVTLAKHAVPDINIPHTTIEIFEDTFDIIATAPGGNFQIVKPKPVTRFVDLVSIPRIVNKPEIIICKKSLCILKCKRYRRLHRFPSQKSAIDVWARQLRLEESPSGCKKICGNHFSNRMYLNNRLTSCAIPDINLPGQVIFRWEHDITSGLTIFYKDDQDAATTTETENDVDTETKQPEHESSDLTTQLMVKNPIPTFQPEILINPVENIKNLINSSIPNKDGILHVFQPGIESKSSNLDRHANLSTDSINKNEKCVLNCTTFKSLFEFPADKKFRHMWLERIGLTHWIPNSRICNRHFSNKMLGKKKPLIRAYPDLNIPEKPRTRDTSMELKNYRLILDKKCVYDIKELPQYICVLTVFKGHTEVSATVKNIQYIEHKLDKNPLKREREVQVDIRDLVRPANVSISPYDSENDFETQEDAIEPDDFEGEGIENDKIEFTHVFGSKINMYECLICGEITVGSASNNKHADLHRESKSLCFQCGRFFYNMHELKIHEKTKHKNLLNNVIRCPKIHCRKAFRTKEQLEDHIDDHTTYVDRRCKICTRIFSSSFKFNYHRLACRRNKSLLQHRAKVPYNLKRKIK